MKILKKQRDLECSTNRKHKIQKQPLKGVLQNNRLTKNLFWRVALLEIWSKYLKNTPKGVHFWFILSCKLVSLFKNSSTSAFSCFSTVAERLIFRTPSSGCSCFYCFFGKRCSSDVIKPIRCGLQSKWSLRFIHIMTGWLNRTRKKATGFKFLLQNCWETVQVT